MDGFVINATTTLYLLCPMLIGIICVLGLIMFILLGVALMCWPLFELYNLNKK